jgi:hypothetical protein
VGKRVFLCLGDAKSPRTFAYDRSSPAVTCRDQKFRRSLDAQPHVIFNSILFVMALSRGIRLLAAITMLIFFWLVLQVFRAPSSVEPPAGPKIEDWTQDPNLDGEQIYTLTNRPLN